MNQTYYAIANLNSNDSYKIFLRCLNFFTQLNLLEENRGKTQKQINYEKKMVNNFKTLLCYLGEFRNMLAHNQPIYCYNVSEYSINGNPKFKYELPKANPEYKDKNGNKVPIEKQQTNIMGSLMNSLKEYFGSDNFNSNNSTKLDLSKIIYILYKMLNHIDKNTKFYSELVGIYSKYNIVLSKSIIEVENPKQINELKSAIAELSSYDMEISNLIKKIESNKSYKMDLKAKEKQLKRLIQQVNSISKNITVNEIKSKYKHFPARKRYTEFTGINANFFINIK